jgi:hypothetical protein
MANMTLDAALNLIWFAIGVLALAGWVVIERHRYHRSHWRSRGRRLAAVALVAVALFPCVSFSDDLFSFSFFFHHAGRHESGATPPEDAHEKADLHLARLLLTLDQYQVHTTIAIGFSFAFFTFVFLRLRQYHAPVALVRSGRAPPSF